MYLRLLPLIFLIMACSSQEPAVVVGKAYDSSKKVVLEPNDEYHLNDIVYIQVFNGGTPFASDTIALNIYEVTGAETPKLLHTRPLIPQQKATDIVVRGPDSNPLTARKFLHSNTPGEYLIEARSGTTIIATTSIKMYKGSK